MKVTPVKGTNDYLPEQMLLRDKMQQAILSTFSSCGFLHIATPALEDVENLTHSDGGDNLNLIYKILKRGEKLEKALENSDYENRGIHQFDSIDKHSKYLDFLKAFNIKEGEIKKIIFTEFEGPPKNISASEYLDFVINSTLINVNLKDEISI